MAGTAGDRDATIISGEVHGRVRQAAGDLGQESPGHQNSARFLYLGADLSAGRNLVVKRGEDEPIAGRFDEYATQDGQGGALGKELHRERDCLTEDVTIDLELHFITPNEITGPAG